MRRELNKLFPAAKEEMMLSLWPKVLLAKSTLQTDAVGDDIEAALVALKRVLQNVAEGIIERINELHATSSLKHTQKWRDAVKASVGIDLSTVIGTGELANLMSVASIRNARLITSMADELHHRIASTVLDSLTKGEGAKELQGRLQHQYGISQRRARTIARDQTSKLTNNLNRFRQEQAGLTKYEWSTSQDERVRPTHQANEGRVFEWKKPSSVTGHPGEDVNCRCVPIAIVE